MTGLVARATPVGFVPDSHDSLVQEYAEKGKKFAVLWAKHGYGNVSERKFKALLSAIQVSIRDGHEQAGKKITDSHAEALAYSDPRAKAMLESIESERMAFAQAEIDIDLVKERLRHMDATIRRGI